SRPSSVRLASTPDAISVRSSSSSTPNRTWGDLVPAHRPALWERFHDGLTYFSRRRSNQARNMIALRKREGLGGGPYLPEGAGWSRRAAHSGCRGIATEGRMPNGTPAATENLKNFRGRPKGYSGLSPRRGRRSKALGFTTTPFQG